ncbi:protein CMSS1 [Anguilla anguilla]|uniref:protein CMSS1 n=1 Tax=Anguilla anguilla TaxID=7936 RepID=UPI0015AE2269|nr:protein CMSS1 [Anguilla anguilla]
MGDDLGDEWWKQNNDSEASEKDEPQEEATENLPEDKKAKKRKTESKTVKPNKAKRKKKTTQKECIVAQEKKEEGEEKEPKPKKRRKKKTITDVLATSEPKVGSPADLQKLVHDHYSDKRSVIEMEELKLPDSCFLASNDLTHSLSSYLKEICPKWAKVQRLHTEKRSVALLIVCSSALRTIELIKQMTTFKGEAKVIKLFAKHIKVEEQVKLLDKAVTHIGVGTPGRIKALIEKEGLSLQALRFLVLDWNWRDQKQRRMVDVPEVKGDLLKLLESGVMKGCQEGGIKLGLF